MAYGTVNADVIGTSVAGSNLGAGNATRFKNRIINGNMVIDQRNAGASVTPTATTYTLDRFYASINVASKFSVQQNAGSVTLPAGYINYLGVTSLAATTVGSTDYYQIRHSIEGLNIADLAWGTASAKTVTLSFLVYSSLTGTFSVSLFNSAENRFYPSSYTISSANTWTQISITVPGDTTGTWLTTNGKGITVNFGLGLGSTYTTSSANAWTATSGYGVSSAVNVVGTNGATWYVTGVQLEVGSSATGFEVVDYTTQLAMCQRYYELFGQAGIGRATAATTCDMSFSYCVTKRTTPTIVLFASGSAQITEATVATRTVTSISSSYPGTNGTLLSLGVSGGGMTSPNMLLSFPNNYPNGFLSASAEL